MSLRRRRLFRNVGGDGRDQCGQDNGEDMDYERLRQNKETDEQIRHGTREPAVEQEVSQDTDPDADDIPSWSRL